MTQTKLCKCGCGRPIIIKPWHKKYGVPDFLKGHNRKGISHIREKNPMWGKHHTEEMKTAARERMLGNKYAAGTKSPHIVRLNKSRIGIPISEERKEKQRRSILKYWNSERGIEQKSKLSHINQKWAAQNPEHKIMAAKNGHRKCPQISSLERKVEVLLQESGIDYIPQYEYELGFLDFFIQPNIALFINGNYWHNFPKGTDKDKQQLAFLKSHGYSTLVIWEHELSNTASLKQKLKAFCSNKFTPPYRKEVVDNG